MLTWLKDHPNEDITTSEAAEALGWSKTETTQTLHGLIRYGMAGQLSRTGQSTWLYRPPATKRLMQTDDVSFDVPVGFRGEVMVVERFTLDNGGHQFLLAVLRDGEDTGLRLLSQPIVANEFTAPPGARYEDMYTES